MEYCQEQEKRWSTISNEQRTFRCQKRKLI
ncbi:hypothetical protein KKD37_00150 [Patescibacteria group bacterium]|nr:hypothetical protein [Patescibacteria group bacterium]